MKLFGGTIFGCGLLLFTTAGCQGGANTPCAKDADCKGARICLAGLCVDPPDRDLSTATGGAEDLAVAQDLAGAAGNDLSSGGDLAGSSDLGPAGDLSQIPDLIGVPQCTQAFSFPLDCTASSGATSGATSGASVIDSYACATGETGPEISYPFSVSTDRTVTVSLTGATVDLDLIVLDGAACYAGASCEAHSTTLGTGNESVTFLAKANQSYLLVVDGHAGATGSFTLNISCAGCKPIKALSCNTSFAGDTTAAGATNAISSYMCDPSTAGPEDSYTLTQSVQTNYKITLSGLTQDLDLLVVFDSNGCDPSNCKASNVASGTASEVVTFTGFNGSMYDVIVDSKGVGGPFMLQIDCPPSCLGSPNMDCNTPTDSRSNNDPTLSQNLVTSWGTCDSGTIGPEVIYTFQPPMTGMYTFTLTGLTHDLDLIVMAGTSTTCDPTTACVASSVTAGTANETVTFQADATKTYYVAVDGRTTTPSPYKLTLTSALCPGPSCANNNSALGCTYLSDTRRNDDPVRSTKVIDNWTCDMNTTGPEVVYAFTPTKPGSFNVTLDQLTQNLDLIVLSNSSPMVCDSLSACVMSSTNGGTTPENLTFAGDISHTYYIAVDGKNGAVSSYHIGIASASCSPTCSDGFMSLSCSASSLSTSNRNDALGATNDVSAWGACDTNTTGPEFAHLFNPPAAGTYQIEMIGLHADLDLIVLETSASAPTCNPAAACFTSSTNAGTADEKVTINAAAGKSYWIIVDGKNGATSSYTLAVTSGCP